VKQLSIAWMALVVAACASSQTVVNPPGAPATICMPCGNDCQYPCTPTEAVAVAPKPSPAVVVRVPAPPPPAAPVAAAAFDPAPGTFASPQSVALYTTTPGAVIRYTTDGSAPTTASPVYTGPIPVTGTTTVTAIAMAEGIPHSDVSSATYTILPPPPPPPPPRVVVTPEKLEIKEKVFFDTGKVSIQPASYGLLDEVAATLKDNGDVQRVVIEGHTDDKGNPAVNEKLSKGRAEAVKSYLVDKGVEAERLDAKGFGSAKPIASNKSAKGREENRRVEFVISPAKQ
jgi:outer membrane protein OmpA-like peptidoglycan-associated protein